MKHKIGYNRLGRRTGHRKAMTRNMLTSLFRYGRIRTTKAKALAVRRTAEKMITRAKLDSVHNRRIIGRDIKDQAVLAKMFVEIGPRFKERPGGYTRVLKLGPRPSDAAEMVILEILGDDEGKPEPTGKKKPSAKKAEAKPAEKKAPKKADTKSKKKEVEESESVATDVKDSPAEEETAEEAPAEEASADGAAGSDTEAAELPDEEKKTD